MLIKQNFHVHTFKSHCSKKEMNISAIIKKAKDVGLKYLGISDHLHYSSKEVIEIVEYNRKLLQNLKKEESISIFLGGEAQMLTPDKVCISSEIAAKLDYVMISPNHYHLEEVMKPEHCTPESFAFFNLDMIEGAINCGFCDIVSHPLICNKIKNSYFDHLKILSEYNRKRLKDIFKRAAQKNIAFEIRPEDVSTAYEFIGEIVNIGKRVNLKFSIGTDAHSLEDLKVDFNILDRLNLKEKDLFNPEI